MMTLDVRVIAMYSMATSNLLNSAGCRTMLLVRKPVLYLACSAAVQNTLTSAALLQALGGITE